VKHRLWVKRGGLWMRDPKRIDRMCRKLRRIWHKWPDQRLGQLIEGSIILSGICGDPFYGDPFYVEDDETERRMDKALRVAKKT